MNIQKVAVEEEYDDTERKGTRVCVTDDENVVWVTNDEFEVREAEQCVVVEEYETGELAETEELNKRNKNIDLDFMKSCDDICGLVAMPTQICLSLNASKT
ncbi:hypothetical protein Tco_1061674 [Tanacetum coccineum]